MDTPTCGGTETSAQVISPLKVWMSEKGIPVRLTTDDGSQFTSGHSKSSVPAGEFVTRSAALTITRATELPRQQSRLSKPFSERRLGMGT